MTPFKALYGREPPPLVRYEIGTTPVLELDEQLAARDEILQVLKHNLERAGNRMKQAADLKRRDIAYEVGEWVNL